MDDYRLSVPASPNGLLLPLKPSPLLGPRVLMRRRKTEQAHICLGVRAMSYLDPDRFALDLLNTVLGEGMSSRLFLNIRERLELACEGHSFTPTHRDTGLLGVYLGVDPKNAVAAVNPVIAEMNALCDQELTAEELQRAKEFTKGRLRLELKTPNGVTSWLPLPPCLSGACKPHETC